MNFLKYLRGMIVEFSVFVSGVVHVLQRLGVFLLALLIILVAFMDMFYTLFLGSGHCEGFQEERTDVCDPEGQQSYPFCTPWDAFLSVYIMLLGEVDEHDFKSSVLATILYIFFVFLVVILLANVLIAIVTDSYSVIQKERAAIVFWSNRLDFIVEMDVLSNGPVTRRVKSIFGSGGGGEFDADPDHDSNNGVAYNLWNHIIELFDKNGPYLKVEVCSMAFICLNFLRFVAIIFVIPIWIILGLCSVGLLWPPQMRQKLMKQKITVHKSAAMVKSEQQKNDVRTLNDSVATFRYELASSIEKQKEDMVNLKADMTSLSHSVATELKGVREILETLLELQTSRG